MVRRLRLPPGEAMPWGRDPFQRVAVILRSDLLSIEYRDGGESQRVEITPGQVECEEPGARVLWAVISGETTLRASHGFPSRSSRRGSAADRGTGFESRQSSPCDMIAV